MSFRMVLQNRLAVVAILVALSVAAVQRSAGGPTLIGLLRSRFRQARVSRCSLAAARRIWRRWVQWRDRRTGRSRTARFSGGGDIATKET